MAVVTNFNDWEKLVQHSFHNELRCTPEEHPVILIDPPLNPKNDREKMVSICFETFNVPYLMLAPEPTCSIIGSGRDSGVVLDSGDSHAHSTCVLDCIPLTWTINRVRMGGRSITDSLVTLLALRGYEMTTSAEREIVRDIKEKLCYVALDTELEDADKTVEYELPDGSKMSVGSELYIAPEQLFDPCKFGMEVNSFHESIYNSIQKLDVEIRREMYQNICLSGGNTMFEGFDVRMLFELEGICGRLARRHLNIVAPPDRKRLSWRGASIIGSMSNSNVHNLWISREQYDDAGATIVHRKIM